MSKLNNEEYVNDMENDVNSLMKLIEVLDHPNLNIKMVNKLTKKVKKLSKEIEKKYNKNLDSKK
tara:strand:- start:47 stop:238 length:192 start_codon:yes stop_codon:yes gene_type:complete